MLNDAIKIVWLTAFFAFLICCEGRAQSPVSWHKDSCRIHLGIAVPPNALRIRIGIHSDRNSRITKLTDVAAKNSGGVNPGVQENKEMWFPVIDVRLGANFKAIAWFEGIAKGDQYCWNSAMALQCGPLLEKLEFVDKLEHWENHLFVQSATARLRDFYVEETICPIAGKNDINHTIDMLTDDWSGTIEVYADLGAEQRLLKEIEVERRPTGPITAIPADDWTREGVLDNLRQTIAYILKAQNTNPLSPTYGGLYLFYDLEAQTYRRPDWIWTYGPAIKLLLDAAKIPEMATAFGYERLVAAARLIAEASLRFQLRDTAHVAYGLTMCRYDPKLFYDGGFSGYLSPADSHFLAGWGWMPYYRATGDKRFLEATVLQSHQIDGLLDDDGIVEQDFVTGAGQWKNWTMDESAFGMVGFAELFAVSGDSIYQQMGKRYLDGIIHVLEGGDGLWYRNWHRNQAGRADDGWPAGAPRGQPVLMKDGQTARGNGWAMMGLLDAHRLLPADSIYLRKALKLAENMLACQLDNGAWPYTLYDPVSKVGISEKATALWSLLFYRLFGYSGDQRHREAAERALKWCMANREDAQDSQASGGIAGDTWASGIVYRNYFPLICTYTMDWFGLALLEHLKLN